MKGARVANPRQRGGTKNGKLIEIIHININMNNLYNISLAFIFLFLINKDFRATKGYIWQKILHALSAFILLSSNLTAFRGIVSILSNYSTFSERNMYARIDYLPHDIGFAISLLSSLLGFVLFVSAFGLLVRGKYSRGIVVWIAPTQVLIGIPIRHYLIINYQNTLEQMLTTWIMIIVSVIYIGLSFLYRSNFMKSFFDAKKKVAAETDDTTA